MVQIPETGLAFAGAAASASAAIMAPFAEWMSTRIVLDPNP
jgi:hypothetical protein